MWAQDRGARKNTVSHSEKHARKHTWIGPNSCRLFYEKCDKFNYTYVEARFATEFFCIIKAFLSSEEKQEGDRGKACGCSTVCVLRLVEVFERRKGISTPVAGKYLKSRINL